jgi:hypothetical protein
MNEIGETRKSEECNSSYDEGETNKPHEIQLFQKEDSPEDEKIVDMRETPSYGRGQVSFGNPS